MSGIIVAGTTLVDKILETDVYPTCGSLAEVKNTTVTVGGCVPNVAIGLKKIDKDLRVAACGKVGADDDGDFVINALREHGADVSQISCSGSRATSFTVAVSVSGGERTFFTYAGACDEFGCEDVKFANGYDMLHLGYMMLLRRMDGGDAAKLLKRAKDKGLVTSLDFVTKAGGDWKSASNVLPYCDYLIVNESEAEKLTGVCVKDGRSAIDACGKLKTAGVRKSVILHKPTCSVMLSENGFFEVPSLELPRERIVGATGAGDAFCAGCLYRIAQGAPEEEILSFASCCAATCLGAADSVSGILSAKKISEIGKMYSRRKSCW